MHKDMREKHWMLAMVGLDLKRSYDDMLLHTLYGGFYEPQNYQ